MENQEEIKPEVDTKVETKTEPKVEPKRVLFLADFACATGFAQVAHNIVSQIAKTQNYQIDVVGINYMGLPNEWQNVFPTIRIFPARIISNGDLFGRSGFINLLSSGAYDLAFTLQDTFNIEPIAEEIIKLRNNLIANGKKAFKWIFYYPIDSTPMENWITKSVALADFPVAYTQYGFNETVKIAPQLSTKMHIIPHGTDINVFNKVEDKKVLEDFRHEYFVGKADGKFLVTNVNRNQPRKDVARTMQIFKYFKQQCPDAVLYLHMKVDDVAYNLDEVARNYGLAPDLDYIVPKNFNEHEGVSMGILNGIYNCSQVIMTTTLGEGWGLAITEAMAAGTPVIAPNHTSITEILADNRGTLVTAGKRLGDWIVIGADNARERPLVDVGEYVDKLVYIHNHYNETQEMASKAREYLRATWNWDVVGKQWQDLFKLALEPKEKIKIGRNDPCHCGSGKKYKNCHLPYEK